MRLSRSDLLRSARHLCGAADKYRVARREEARATRWSLVARLVAGAQEYEKHRFDPLNRIWKRCIERMPAWLRPDPTQEDWTGFRPLRLSREEDWADWLGHLIETCPGGALHRALFEEELGDEVQAFREVAIDWDGRVPPESGSQGHSDLPHRIAPRADLVLTGSAGALHVEVKVGDAGLAKTWPTALSLRYGNHRVDLPHGIQADYLLVRPYQMGLQYEPIFEDQRRKHGIHVKCITWREVGLAIRRLLWPAEQGTTWALLARAYLGAVEQTLLGHPHRDAADPGRVLPGDVDDAATYLTEALDD